MIKVPVLIGFNPDNVVGWLEVDESKLPPTPNFIFTLGYTALNMDNVVEGTIPTTSYMDRYELKSVSPILDIDYLKYLQQIGIAND